MFARIPVPWGDEPKTQVVDGLSYGGFTYDKPARKTHFFEDLFGDLDLTLLVKNPPVPIHLRKLVLSDEAMPAHLDWAVVRGQVRARAPDPRASAVTARTRSEPAFPLLSPAEWKLIEALKAEAPRSRTPEVLALPAGAVVWSDVSPPLSSRGRPRTIRTRPLIERGVGFAAKEIAMPTSLTTRAAAWREMPPSLVKWAVERGIKRAEAPPLPRSQVYALERRTEIFEALSRGEWCRVSDLDIFPWRLRQWLEDCEISLVRWIGGGQVGRTPVNGYVTEDGQIFYAAEDGSTFYVQET